ncbi:MAG: hypothetical protein NC411_00175 [Bacteroides sp.]|nr:hypothetical protein [Bacteroides sp.]
MNILRRLLRRFVSDDDTALRERCIRYAMKTYLSPEDVLRLAECYVSFIKTGNYPRHC